MFGQSGVLHLANIFPMLRSKLLFKCHMCKLNEPCMVTIGGDKAWPLCSWFEDPNHVFPWGLVGINVQLLIAPSTLVICNVPFIIVFSMGHNLWLTMAFTIRDGVVKKCWLSFLLPHNFSQHGHMYLGWHLPFQNVNCTFNNLLISTILCAHSFGVYQNKNHENNNIILPFSPFCTSCHHHNVPSFNGGEVKSWAPWGIKDSPPSLFSVFEQQKASLYSKWFH